MALGANRYVGVEAIGGDMGWSLFVDRMTKSVIAYKVKIERMSNDRWQKKKVE